VYQRYFTRAAEGGLLAQLWDEIESARGGTGEANPYVQKQ
jgi:hypothetical protein